MNMDLNHAAAVCLCADDFGLNAGVNGAVQRLADLGRLHAVGALVGAPGWTSGSSIARHLDAQGLDVGLHLDLVEFPLLPGPRITLGFLMTRAYLGRLDRRRVRAEIRAQLDTFESAQGHGPAFVDGHRHVHQLPGVRDELLAELDDRYGRNPPWIRSTRAADAGNAPPKPDAVTRFKAWTIEWLGARSLSAATRRLGFAQNGHLLGVYDFQGGTSRYLKLLRNWLAVARDGDLLMCHPALHPEPGDSIGSAREAEYQVLGGRAFGELLQSGGVSLWPMSQILLRHP